ncbi:MAG TPA: phage minor head protein [Flavisolibacter sp.]|nr:phage minor head protein [Flavisolibacter sp.]
MSIIQTISAKERFALARGRRQRQLEKLYAPAFYKIIRKQLRDYLKVIDEQGYPYAKANLFTLIDPTAMAETIKGLYRQAAFVEGNAVANSLRRKEPQLKYVAGGGGMGITLDALAPVIDDYFRIFLLEKAALPISQTTREYITKHLITEVDGGKPLDEAVKDFTQLALTGTGKSSYAENRARNIARTESTKALSFGGLIGAYMSGKDVERVWVTSADERVRVKPFSHVHLDGNVTDMFQPFQNGEAINFPGDPTASKANVINCRCCVYFREKQKPKPRIVRTLTTFLSDFFAGFNLGISLTDDFLNALNPFD